MFHCCQGLLYAASDIFAVKMSNDCLIFKQSCFICLSHIIDSFLLIVSSDARCNVFFYISLLLISGFTEFTHEITIPKIEHMNIDGIQPKYNILSVNGDQESTIQFRLCDKTHIQNTITFQTETRFPFILLLLTEGSTVNKHGSALYLNWHI